MKLSFKKVGIAIVYVALLFCMCFSNLNVNPIIDFLGKHFDELITLFLTIYILINFKIVIKERKKLLILLGAFLGIGWISTFLHMYQTIDVAIMDSFLIVDRFIIGYLAMVIYFKKKETNISDLLKNISCVVVVILFVISLHDLVFTPIFPKSTFRYFAESLTLMFPVPTYLAAASVVLIIVLGYTNKKSKNIIFMVMITFVGCMTLRSKAIGFFAVFWFFYIMIFVLKFKNYYMFFAFSGLIALILVRSQFFEYFGENRYSPRAILLTDGLKLFKENFPLGTGFGTFGSSLAATYYSPLYMRFKYFNNLGMNPEDTSFLSDSFWPGIFAQFGFLGFIVFVGIILYFLIFALKKFKINKKAGFAMLMTLIYLIIASFAETSFFNPTSLLFFIMFAIYEFDR